MKPDHLTVEATADSLDEAVEKALSQPGCTRAETGVELARRMTRKMYQSGRPATTPPLRLNERRILHDLFKQDSGLESRPKEYQGVWKAMVLQKRG